MRLDLCKLSWLHGPLKPIVELWGPGMIPASFRCKLNLYLPFGGGYLTRNRFTQVSGGKEPSKNYTVSGRQIISIAAALKERTYVYWDILGRRSEWKQNED